VLDEAVRAQYAEQFAVLPTPAYLTYGNVDVPSLWAEHLRPGHTVLDGQVADIGGRRWGFVGGGLRTPMRTPYEIDDETYAAKVAAVGAVDVLACHIPPDVPGLLYDVRPVGSSGAARRCSTPSATPRPGWSCSATCTSRCRPGLRIGRTECVNVGHFRATGRPFVLEY
jgi:hypothetical protein